MEKQAEAIRVEQIKLYESYADGVLLRDAYIEKKKALSEKLAALQDSIRTEKEEQECADELDEEIRALTKQASEKTYIGGLTKECVDAFVSMVYLYPVQIGLGVRNFRLNLKNVCADSIGKIFSNLCGNAAGGEVSNKSFAHDKCTSFD